MSIQAKTIQKIGNELAIIWSDDRESYFHAETLRKYSPSAANMGEKDIFGNQYGGDGPREFPGIQIEEFFYIGNYAIRIRFSDDHASGIFSWEYLRELDDKIKSE